MYQNLVDNFGNVPYSEALGGVENKTPAYDDGRLPSTATCQARLGADIATLNAGGMLVAGVLKIWFTVVMLPCGKPLQPP